MRLKILMCFLQPASLPWGYPQWARGLVCTAVGCGLYQAAHRLHAPGWGHPEERRYKLLTYSWPHGLRSVRTGLWPQGAAAWWVPSPVPAAVEGLAPGLPGTEFRLRLQPVTEKQIGVEPTPAFTARSPITPFRWTAAGGRQGGQAVSFSPEELGFARAEKLRRKAGVFNGEPIPGDLGVRLREPYSANIRGRMVSFTVSGLPDLIRLGYEAGPRANTPPAGSGCCPWPGVHRRMPLLVPVLRGPRLSD